MKEKKENIFRTSSEIFKLPATSYHSVYITHNDLRSVSAVSLNNRLVFLDLLPAHYDRGITRISFLNTVKIFFNTKYLYGDENSAEK